MVQVLPGIPGFGEKLADALGNAANNLGQGYLDRKMAENDQRIVQDITNSKDQSPLSIFQKAASLSKGAQERFLPIYSAYSQGQQKIDYLNRQGEMANTKKTAETEAKTKKEEADKLEKQQLQSAQTTQKLIDSGFSPEEATQRAPTMDPKQADEYFRKSQETKANLEKSERETADDKQNLQRVLDRSIDLYHGGSLGWRTTPDKWLPGAIADRAEFDALRANFVNIIKKLESSGQMSQKVFEDVTKRLAESTDSQNSIYGTIRGIASSAGLDSSALDTTPEDLKGIRNHWNSTPYNTKVKIVDVNTGEEFYPSSKQDIDDAKADSKNWKVIRG